MKDICHSCFQNWKEQQGGQLVHFYEVELDIGGECRHCGKKRGLLDYLK